MSWHRERMTAFDIETTSAQPETARIVTASIVHIQGATIEKRGWLVNPGVDIEQGAIDVHGVTNERAQTEGIDPATAAAQIFSELNFAWTGGRPVVGYNIVFDLTILDRELRRWCGTSLDGVIGPVVDGFVIDKAFDRYRKGSRKLVDTCTHYGVRIDGAHDAAEDALAAARLAWRMAEHWPAELSDLAALHDKQVVWKREQADSFRAYLEKQGKPADDVRGDWPLVPFTPAPACIGSDA